MTSIIVYTRISRIAWHFKVQRMSLSIIPLILCIFVFTVLGGPGLYLGG